MNMRKVKLSHEVPFCLLEQNLKWSNYQYCLPHLMEEDETYRNFFLQCKENGVEIYLDNSLHELGESVGDELLIKWINILEPTTFFIPDVWEDKTSSIVNARRWATIQVPEKTTKCAVVQAKSIHEAYLCVQAYKDLGYKKIAFSYGAQYYHDLAPHPDKDFGKAIGRYMVLSQMYEDKLLSPTDRVHLLGTASPIEFGLYKNIKCIESIDTSNPIMAGIEKRMYHHLGISPKPVANMNKYQDVSEEFIETELIEYNVRKFREINEL
jgi:predicted peroxiredoxin